MHPYGRFSKIQSQIYMVVAVKKMQLLCLQAFIVFTGGGVLCQQVLKQGYYYETFLL